VNARAIAIAAAVITTVSHASADDVSVTAGAQLGVVFPYGVRGTATYQPAQGRAWDLDLAWQPSANWQSYSVGVATRPLRGVLFAGMRLRYLQLHPPWSRGFDGSFDHQLGVEAELGVRARIGPQRRFEITAALGVLAVPSGDTRLPVLYIASIGFGYELWTAPRD
jgi:hypothetical protein